MTFKKIEMNNVNINKYKKKHKGLSHIRTGKDYKGYIYIDKDDNVVGFINMRISDKYIQAIEVSSDYQGQGLGKTLLNELINMGAIRLSVNKKNTKAKKLYDKLFKVEREDENMYYMILKISDYLKEGRELSNMKAISFKDLTTYNVLITENFNIITETNEKNNDVINQDISNKEIIFEADDDLGPTDYNEDDTTDENVDDNTTDENEDDTETDNTDDDLDTLESETDDPAAEPTEGDTNYNDVENSNEEQMNNDNDQDNENNKFLIKDYLELYNRLEIYDSLLNLKVI